MHIPDVDRLKKKNLVSIFLANVTCSAYALPQLDTIDSATGGIDKDSVLNLVVFGVYTIRKFL